MWMIAGKRQAPTAQPSPIMGISGAPTKPPSRKSLYGLPTASTEQPHRQQHHDRQEATIMPFGKHQHQSLRRIFESDRHYLIWCLSQSWFRTKFGMLFGVIVEMFHRAGQRWSEE